MGGLVLPILGWGSAALGAGAGVLGIQSGIEDLKDKYTEKAYEDGPDVDGNFDTGSRIGNWLVRPESREFETNYLKNVRRDDDDLNKMMTLLGPNFQRGDGTKTKEQLKTLNLPAYQKAQQKQQNELEEGSFRNQQEEKRYVDRMRIAEQARLDALKAQRDTLNFQMLQAQRENDRYYDRLEREDARLRREGYQSLGTGLAALAAAFTIV